MNLDLLEAFFGKRFTGLVVCVIALVVGFFFGKPELFPSLATSLGLMYGVYVGGQTASDIRESSDAKEK
jgi:uncharacterized membrane protein YccC